MKFPGLLFSASQDLLQLRKRLGPLPEPPSDRRDDDCELEESDLKKWDRRDDLLDKCRWSLSSFGPFGLFRFIS